MRRTLVVAPQGLAAGVLGFADGEPVAVVEGSRVIGVTRAASSVPLGCTAVQAVARMPSLRVVERDHRREQRWLGELVQRLDSVSPSFRICGDVVAAPVRSMQRYFGSDETMVAAVDRVLGEAQRSWPTITMSRSVADSFFAARLLSQRGMILAPRTSRSVLAALPVEMVLPQEMASVCARVGLRSVGEMTRLEPAAITARFGREGLSWFRRCRIEEDLYCPRLHEQTPTTVSIEVDDTEDIERVLFGLASPLEEVMARHEASGLVLTECTIAMIPVHGPSFVRVLHRIDGVNVREVLAALRRFEQATRTQRGELIEVQVIVDRWSAHRPRQLSFDGQEQREGEIVHALARVATLVGDDHVRVPRLEGGRSPAEAATFQPWSGVWPNPTLSAPALPWPGRLDAAVPSVVYRHPREVQLLAAAGEAVRIDHAGLLVDSPAIVVVGSQRMVIDRCYGPWPVIERWWERRSRRYLRVLVVTSEHGVHLVCRERQRWTLEASFD
ncbi:MAG: hypothetical protein ACYDHP_00770 [Ferrimicrobium sp.]